MDDKEKGVETTTTDAAPAQSNGENNGDGSNGTSPAPESQKPDGGDDTAYAEELDKLKKQLGQAEHTIVTVKGEKKEVEEGANKEIEVLKTQIQSLEKLSLDVVLSKHTSNPAEKDLIEFHMKNTIKSSGNLEQDILTAKAIVQSTVGAKRAQEIKAATEAKETAGAGGSNGSQDKPKVAQKFWSDDQLAELKRRNIDPDIAWKNYQETLNK